MTAGAGFCLKTLQWFLRGVQLACASIILAINSYFIASMAAHKVHIPTRLRVVEGIAGVAVAYAFVGLLCVCCLAGFILTSFIAMVLDTAFLAAFIYVAVVFKEGTQSCQGTSVETVFGTGDASSRIESGNLGRLFMFEYGTVCRMEKAILAVAIVVVILFLFSATTELALGRHRKKEQRFGPSPANNYTSGYGRGGGLFGFGRARRAGAEPVLGDPNALPMHTSPDAVRNSRDDDEDEARRLAAPNANANATTPEAASHVPHPHPHPHPRPNQNPYHYHANNHKEAGYGYEQYGEVR